jgi:hypothetical protein
MSVQSPLKQLLTQLLSRFLKFLVSIRGLPPCRLISHIFAFLASLRRWTRTNPRRPTLYQRPKPPTSLATLDSGIVCAMNVPSPGPSDAHERARPSPVDSPYTNARSQSGHLIPYSPAPARRYSRDYIPWMAGSQASLHEEPSDIDHDRSQVATDSILPSSSSTTVGSHTPSSDVPTHPSHPHSPPHQTIGFALETSPGTPSVKTSPRTPHLHFDTNKSEPYRSRTPLSVKSSQLSVSQKSCNSRNSIGRASYRAHRGPPARVRTPASNQDALVFGPPSLRTAEPGGPAVFGTIIAPPSADDPNRPGEPIGIGGPRFYPMSVNGVLRYEYRKTR